MLTFLRDFFNTKCLGRVKGLDDSYISYEYSSFLNNIADASAAKFLLLIGKSGEREITEQDLDKFKELLMSVKITKKLDSKIERGFPNDKEFLRIIGGRIYALFRFFSLKKSSKYINMKFILATLLSFLQKCINHEEKSYFINLIFLLSDYFESENADLLTKSIFLLDEEGNNTEFSIIPTDEMNKYRKIKEKALLNLEKILNSQKNKLKVYHFANSLKANINSEQYSQFSKDFFNKFKKGNLKIFNGESVEILISMENTIYINERAFGKKGEEKDHLLVKLIGALGREFYDRILGKGNFERAIRVERSISNTKTFSIGYEFEIFWFHCLDYKYWRIIEEKSLQNVENEENQIISENNANQGILKFPRNLILTALPSIMFSS